MIPFSGLMQAFSMGQAPGGEKAAGVAKALPAMSKLGRDLPALDGDPNSFLEWVRKLSEIDVEAAMKNGDGIGNDLGDSVADDSNLQVLQALIGEALARQQLSPPIPQRPAADIDGDNLSIDQKVAADALIANSEGNHPSSNAQINKVLAAVEQMMTTGGGDADQGEILEDNSVVQGELEKTSGKPDPKMPHPLTALRETQSPVDLEGASVPSTEQLGVAVPKAGRGGNRPEGDQKHDADRAVESNFFHSSLRSEKAHATTSARGDSAPEKPKAEIPVPTVAADPQTPAAQDEANASRYAGKNTPASRTEGIDGQENDAQKIHSLDTVKDGSGESAKTAVSFQDATRSVAADKPIAATQAPLERGNESTVRTFQSTVMDQIVEKASVRSIQGRSEIHIRLKPEFLGHVQMHVTTDKEQIVVRVVTDQPVVKEIIEKNLHHLKTELNNQGLTIDKFDVSVSPDTHQQQHRESFAHMFRHSPTPNNRRDTPEQEPDSKGRHGDERPDDGGSDRDRVNYFV